MTKTNKKQGQSSFVPANQRNTAETKDSKNKIFTILNRIGIFLSFFAPILLFYLTESIVHEPFEDMNQNAQILNVVLFELLYLFLFAVFGSIRVALITETIFFTIFAVANFYVISFRATPIQPWDFYSIRTAASVAGDFKYTLPKDVLVKLIVILILIILFSLIRTKKREKWLLILRGILFVVSVSSLTVFTKNIHDENFIAKMRLYDKLFTPTTIYYRDGGPVAFLMECQYLSIDVPSHYSEDTAKELLNNYNSNPLEQENINRPNIIVIMNEAFSDPGILQDFTTNEDYMPFMRTLQTSSSTITGNLHVSVLGGNTANTEFEFLTGNTTAFLPNGSVAYQQYVHGPIDCLPQYLKNFGYRTYAAHPYRATGWCRDKVYEYMQFDHMDFIDSFQSATKVRNYVSDAACTDYIEHIYEQNRATGDPMFLFLVTMQNHSSYTKEYDNFTPDITVEGTDSFALNSYLSLIKKSDQALADLIAYFETVPEETVIVFFGDHQPTDSVVSPIYKLNQKSISKITEEERYLRYQVPFVIWRNFDNEIEASHDMNTSINFLGSYVLQAAGLPLSPYQNFLKETREEFPVVTAQMIQTKDGIHHSVTDQKDALHDYQVLQYYQIFDAY